MEGPFTAEAPFLPCGRNGGQFCCFPALRPAKTGEDNRSPSPANTHTGVRMIPRTAGLQDRVNWDESFTALLLIGAGKDGLRSDSKEERWDGLTVTDDTCQGLTHSTKGERGSLMISSR